MLNNIDIIVFDFETGGLNPEHNEAIQVAGKAYQARTLEPYPDGEFCSLMKPMYFDRLDPRALQCNGKTLAELEKAPDQKTVWLQFCDWVSSYNRGAKKTIFTAPIAAGKNIRSFDMKFLETLNKLHHPKKEKAVLFSRRRELDVEDYIFAWFENDEEPENEKMDTLRDYFGMSKEGAHDALVDVRQTGDLLTRFIKLHRELRRRKGRDGTPFIKLKGSFRQQVAAA